MLKAAARSMLQFLGHRYPLYSGCGTLANSAPWRSIMAGHDEEAVARVRGTRARLIVPVQDFIGAAVHSFGDLDPKVTWVVRRILRPGDTALDIGANLGLVAVAMADAVGPQGRVEAFEPQPRFAALARRSAALNGFRHLTIHDVALGRRDATVQLHIPRHNKGTASIARVEGAEDVIEVPQRAAGAMLASLGLGPIRLLKIDVEGYEPEVLGGAEAYLRRNPPDAILFELNEYAGAFHDQPLVGQLASLGYRFAEIPKCLWRMRLRQVRSNELGKLANDILAVRHDATGDAIFAATNAA
ncbi:FkbM family methyltransferase [Falsiroseomonas tokyonensis]|uniref:FkbM family methyltransferase n=1 Tax=Falsiroseomonas tokyonensis TaxID=430521 RepID=A0ABV7C1B5_9PROT|nr:FkbM family methyltransferase [Falsiroseomonas tokyonensis]MBU8540743.1 FkbM family methyltransferase [Falsiroseomonas tokyonensis]